MEFACPVPVPPREVFFIEFERVASPVPDFFIYFWLTDFANLSSNGGKADVLGEINYFGGSSPPSS
jgi:hypothetical protein